MENINITLSKQYIGEDIEIKQQIEDIIKENQIILLVAPQGVGKSNMLMKLNNYNKLFISPTISTAEQVENSTDAVITRGRSFYTFSIQGSVDQFGNTFNPLTSTTFGSSDGIINHQLINNYDLLIVDEVHKLVQYSTFGYNNVSAVLDTINTFIEHGKKVLFTTATPELLICLQDIDEFPNINICLNILNDKTYISKCEVINYITNSKILSLLTENKKKDNFQIVLYNNKKAIKEIEHELNKRGIKAISVNGKQYRENEEVNELVNNIKNADYKGYSVLLATSWIDVGLNFIGNNITHIYCFFDSEYTTGDFTIIKQFMARTRNSEPILYINKPIITKQERRLLKFIQENGIYDVKKGLTKFANKVLENYIIGYLKNINVQDYYGIYLINNDEYGFSKLTLNYQLEKLNEKNTIHSDLQQLKEILKVKYVKTEEENVNELFVEECIKLNEVMNQLEKTGEWCTIGDMKNLLMELTNGRIVRKRPKRYIEKYLSGYILKEKNKSIDGRSKKGYIIEKHSF